jgi:predicted methyltransferase
MGKFLILSLACLFTANVFAADIYSDALGAKTRPPEDLTDDARRQPDKVLSFLEVKPDMRVLDLFSGGGYYSEIVANIVGEKGHVDAHNNTPYINYIGVEKLEKRYGNGRLTNVQQLHQEANALALCEACYDRVLMILTFHDLYHVDTEHGWDKIDAPVLMAKIRASMKADGVLGIVDHVAPAGSPEETGNSTHRIDPQLIKDKMAQWGFSFVGEANFLRNPKDTGELPMWDASVKGKTDRAVMKFALSK